MLYNGYDEIFASGLLAGADGGMGRPKNIMGWRYQGMVGAEEGDIQTAQKLQTECNKVIDLLIKTGVFRGLKTVLHYMDVVSVPLCRKPFGPVNEKYLPRTEGAGPAVDARARVSCFPSPALPGEGETTHLYPTIFILKLWASPTAGDSQ
ncbi:dihydrodipicolinate synthase family protein [Shigella flexneri]